MIKVIALIMCTVFSTPCMVDVVKKHIPQARQQGWRHKYEYKRHYTPKMLVKKVNVILGVSHKLRLDPLFVLTIAIEQSRLHSTALGKNNNGSIDVGLFQINCPSRYCKKSRKPKVRQAVAKSLGVVDRDLYNPKTNAIIFIDWYKRRNAYCLKTKSKRCRLNKRLHGNWIPMFHPKKTRRIYRDLRAKYLCKGDINHIPVCR